MKSDSYVWDSCDIRFFYNSLSSVLWENQIPDIRGIWIGSSNIFSLCSGNENKVIYLDWVLKFLVLDDSRELNLSNIEIGLYKLWIVLLNYSIYYLRNIKKVFVHKLVGSVWRVSRVFENLMWLRFLAGKTYFEKYFVEENCCFYFFIYKNKIVTKYSIDFWKKIRSSITPLYKPWNVWACS